jgi:CheY-like chemotaxis protein
MLRWKGGWVKLPPKSSEIVIACATDARYALWAAQFGARVQTRRIESGHEVLAHIAETTPALVLIDTDLPDMGALDLARQLVSTNAMVNIALVSDAPRAHFHEATEGLGILAQLPIEPVKAPIDRLVSDLFSLGAL